MPLSKRKCSKCGAEILPATAERTGGLCLPCKERRPRPVVLTEEQAGAELQIAAASLENRAQLLRIQAKKVPLQDWGGLPGEIRDLFPDWYRGLLSRYSLYGVVIECRDPLKRGVCGFAFNGPQDLGSMDAKDSPYAPLAAVGFVPVGDDPGGSGNSWVIQSPATPASPVFYLELSGWGGGVPTRHNGLRFAASRLSLLLSSMAISEVSYYNSPAGVTSLIWHEDREPPPEGAQSAERS
jgi:hypothetical protein